MSLDAVKLSCEERKHVSAIDRRISHLSRRIADADRAGLDLSWDKQERAALVWAKITITVRMKKTASERQLP